MAKHAYRSSTMCKFKLKVTQKSLASPKLFKAWEQNMQLRKANMTS